MGHKGIQGQLSLEEVGKGMPPGDPIANGYPYYWQNIERLILVWETDLEACRRLCPEFLEVDPASTARVVFYNFQFCTAGPYQEASLQFKVFFEGQPYWYEFKNIVNSDIGFATGREVLGIPKKMGWLTWEKDVQYGLNVSVGRGSSIPVMTASFLPIAPTEMADEPPSVSVRVIPHPEGGKPQITLINSQDPSDAKFELHEGGFVYAGRGSVAFHANSLMDAWHEFRVQRLLSAEFLGGSNRFSVGNGVILAEL